MSDAIIFDLDGTLWDATRQIVISNNITLSRHPDVSRRVTVEEMRTYMGKTIEEIAALVFPDMAEGRRNELMYECCDDEAQYFREYGGTLYTGLPEALSEAKRCYTLFVVSNCQDGYLQACLDHHMLWEFFTDIEMAGRTGLTKGGNIRLIMERNNVGRAVYVGDTMGDYMAAVEAGIPFIHAAYGFGAVPGARHVITDVSQIKSCADEVFTSYEALRTALGLCYG